MSLNPTAIEWVVGPDGAPGRTWNPIVGCSRGCSYCYARRIAKRFKHQCQQCHEFTPHLHPERLGDPAKRKKPTGIFVCSMGELFDPALPPVNTSAVLAAMWEVPRHRYYLLTKRPKRLVSRLGGMYAHDPWWVGTSVSTQPEADERIPQLLKMRGDGDWPVLYASVEPLLGPVVLPFCEPLGISREGVGYPATNLDWVIIGAQTGPRSPVPDPAWVQALIDQCREANVPVFLKDNLKWPETIQEMPEG